MSGERLKSVFSKAAESKATVFALSQAAALGAGFLFAFSGRGRFVSPLGVAFVSAVGEKRRISASLGAALGYIMYCDSLNSLRFIAAILCAYVLSKLLSSYEITGSALSMGIVSAFCVFSTGVALGFAEKVGTGTLLQSATEAVLSFCAAFIFRNAFRQLEIKKSLKGMLLREFVFNAAVLSMLVWSIYGFRSVYFTPAAALVFYLMLLSGELYSGLGAVIFGSQAGAVFFILSDCDIVPLGFVLGSVVTATAYFSVRDYRVRSLIFFLSPIILLFAGFPFEGSYAPESVLAAVLFAFTPKKPKERLVKYILGSDEPIYNNEVRKGLSAQLHLASSAVSEISSAVTAVCAGLERGEPSARGEVFSRVTGSLCSSCAKYENCWLEDRERTVSVFDGLFSILKNDEYLDYQSLTQDAKNRCIKASQLARAFNGAFNGYTVEAQARREKGEMRKSVAQQFYSVSDILDDIAKSFGENYYADSALGERVRATCFSLGIKPLVTSCKTGENGRLRIEIECEEIKKEFTGTLLRERLEAVCSKPLEQPVIIRGEKTDCISVCEKYPLEIEVGASQIKSDGEKVCGDSFEHFFDGRGAFDIVLADGMGTGARAALDSAMARGLTSTLLKKGISPEGALRLVNSALMVKSPDESMSTLDIMQVDMFSGKTEFFKAGATSSFVRRKGRIQEIKRPALPLGILRRVEFARVKGSVSEGDIAILLSDGITDCGADMVREVLKKGSSLSSSEIAQRLTDSAVKIKGKKHDDLTAVVCKFH